MKEIYKIPVDKIEEPNIVGKIDVVKIVSASFNTKRCCYCGGLLDKKELITKDHLIPKSKGGKNIERNLKPCCQKCNIAKGSRFLEEFLLDFTRKNEYIKYSHVKSFKRMFNNIFYHIQYVKGCGNKLFINDVFYQLYKLKVKKYNFLISEIQKMKK